MLTKSVGGVGDFSAPMAHGDNCSTLFGPAMLAGISLCEYLGGRIHLASRMM